ncbi:MAG: hypothetical protein KDA68_10095 [Planctomycetaceae bacterium]|nr:hypothetical protein [Planctomycetaceae bacterium]MCA9097512.1 hypothetical protein [Planctomycetaceae bacterium]
MRSNSPADEMRISHRVISGPDRSNVLNGLRTISFWNSLHVWSSQLADPEISRTGRSNVMGRKSYNKFEPSAGRVAQH